MHGPRDLARRCCFWALAALLAGCANLADTFEVEPFLREQITGDSWRACLAREYQTQSRYHVRAGRNWGTAAVLAAKGQAALDGEDVGPEPQASGDRDLANARGSLDASIAARGQRPCECATAQARYDSWALAVARKISVRGAGPDWFGAAVRDCIKSR